MHLSSRKWRPFCLHLSVTNHISKRGPNGQWITQLSQCRDTSWNTVWHFELYRLISNNTPDSKVRGPTWGPSGADRTQVGLMLAPRTLLSGTVLGADFLFHCLDVARVYSLVYTIWRSNCRLTVAKTYPQYLVTMPSSHLSHQVH